MPEFDYIAWLRSRTPADPRAPVGPGDDCAVLAPVGRQLLVTTDLLTDGTDFILSEVGPRAAGRKAMAVNLSDIAAMAGVPTAAVVAVALPRGGGRSLGEELYVGIREVADEFGVAVVGGDTNSWEGALVVTVTLLGEATARGPVLRSGARPGDWVMLTGPVGGSIRGRHLAPTPRVREALRLHNLVDLHAMIDLSDGLTADLTHVLDESRCGAVLDAAAIPIHLDAQELAKTSGKTALAHALGDGEDFELLFTVSPPDGATLLRDQPVPGVSLAKVGECVNEGLWLDEGGARRPLTATGWVHEL